MYSNRQRRQGLGVYLLAYQLLTMNDNLPPVTLLAVLGQAAIFLGFVPALDFSAIGSLCVSPGYVWRRKEWIRLLFSSFMHADDMHLYYNMVSFIWKGRRLERRFGSPYFAYVLVVFSLLTNIVLVALSVIADEHLHLHLNLMNQCAIGFSGVLFALKVLSNHYFPVEDTWIFGMFPVPSRLACWAELVIIQLLVPNASFIGHLAGILVGLAYVSGPLKYAMDMFVPNDYYQDQSNPYPRRGSAGSNNGPRFWGSGHSGFANSAQPNANYEGYTGGLSEEEQLRRAYEESNRPYQRHTYPSAPPYPESYGAPPPYPH